MDDTDVKKVIAMGIQEIRIVAADKQKECRIKDMPREILSLILNFVIQTSSIYNQFTVALSLMSVCKVFRHIDMLEPALPYNINLKGQEHFSGSRDLYGSFIEHQPALTDGLMQARQWKSIQFRGISSDNIERLIGQLSQNPESTTNIEHLDLFLSTITDDQLNRIIESCPNLQTLDLSRCNNLTSLPAGIGNLTKLQKLVFDSSSRLESLPKSIGNLTNLQKLVFDACSRLESLPSEIGNLTNLQTLNLSWCSRLKSLPESIGNLTNLQTLNLSCCTSLEYLPAEIGGLTQLQTLDLGVCENLRSLPGK